MLAERVQVRRVAGDLERAHQQRLVGVGEVDGVQRVHLAEGDDDREGVEPANRLDLLADAELVEASGLDEVVALLAERDDRVEVAGAAVGADRDAEHSVITLADGVHRPAVADHAVHLPGRGERGVDAVQVERVEVAGVVVLAARRGDRAATGDAIVAAGQPAREQSCAARAPGTARCSRSNRDDAAVRRAGGQVELVGRRVGQVGVDGEAAGRRGVGRGGVEADDGDGAERRAVVGDRDLVAAEHRLRGGPPSSEALGSQSSIVLSRTASRFSRVASNSVVWLSGSVKSRSGRPAWSTRRTTPSCRRAVTRALSYSTVWVVSGRPGPRRRRSPAR